MDNPRRPSKRPAANKKIGYCLTQTLDEDVEFEQKKREDYDFSGFQKLYDSIISLPEGAKMSPEQVVQFRESIQYFIKLKSEISKKYMEASEKYSKEFHPHVTENQKQASLLKHGIMRSLSVRISFDPSSQNLPKQQPVPEPPPEPKEQTTRKYKKIAITPESTTSSQPARQLSAMSIWTQENKFLGVVPTEANLSAYLYPITMVHKRGQLGQHYSIKFNEKLRHKFKNDSVQIRVPLTLASPALQLQQSSEMTFHRLLCALVPLAKEKNIEKTSKTVEQHSVIIQNDEEIYPNAMGTSTYTSIPFEEKIMLEIYSLGLNPDKTLSLQLDNEIARDFDDVNTEYIQSLEKTNKMRAKILQKLKEAEPELLKKAAKRRRNPPVIERSETPKKSTPKKKRRQQFNDD